MLARVSLVICLVACGPDISSAGGKLERDAGLDAEVDSGLCEGCAPCDGGTSRDGAFCCTGCWDMDLCAIISNELTCGESGSVCYQCINGAICKDGSCIKP